MAARVPRLDVWGDELGNLDFDPKTGTRYFVVSTITIADPSLTTALLDLRRDLDRLGYELPNGFHATEDKQRVRDEVFAVLARAAIRADFTYYRKANVYDRIKANEDYFYKWAWFFRMRHVLPRIVPKEADLFVGIATLGVKKKRQLYAQAVRDVVAQCSLTISRHCAYWSSPSHPCLQAADYYTWAVGRWLETGDDRSLDLIRPQIGTLYRFV